MSARKRRIYCDGCGRCGGMYGVKASAAGLAGLRRLLASYGWVRVRQTSGGDRCPGCRGTDAPAEQGPRLAARVGAS